MKENILKGLVAGIGAAVGLYFRELVVPVAILVAVMVLDYATGMADAWAAKALSSKTGILGIVKKLCYLVAVAVAVVVDWVIQSVAAKAGLEMGNFYAFGLLVTIWLILNELISILENLAALGVPLPEFLMKIIEKLKNETEQAGDQPREGLGPSPTRETEVSGVETANSDAVGAGSKPARDTKDGGDDER